MYYAFPSNIIWKNEIKPIYDFFSGTSVHLSISTKRVVKSRDNLNFDFKRQLTRKAVNNST